MANVFHVISPRDEQYTVENDAKYSDDDQNDSQSDGTSGRISIADDGRHRLHDDHGRPRLHCPVRIDGTSLHSTISEIVVSLCYMGNVSDESHL